MVGRELAAVFPEADRRRSARSRSSCATCRTARPASHDVSLSVRRGEILGLAGLVGSGRTELAETLFGLTPADGGEILRPRRAGPHRLAGAGDSTLGIGYVPEDRRQHGVVLEMSVAANASLASLDAVSRRGLIDRGRERRRGRALRRAAPHQDAVGGRPTSARSPAAISRRSRWRAGCRPSPTILILDEPTQGVDVGAKAEIHALMQDLAERGPGDHHDLVGAARDPGHERPHRRDARRHASAASSIAREATQAAILALALDDRSGSGSGLRLMVRACRSRIRADLT